MSTQSKPQMKLSAQPKLSYTQLEQRKAKAARIPKGHSHEAVLSGSAEVVDVPLTDGEGRLQLQYVVDGEVQFKKPVQVRGGKTYLYPHTPFATDDHLKAQFIPTVFLSVSGTKPEATRITLEYVEGEHLATGDVFEMACEMGTFVNTAGTMEFIGVDDCAGNQYLDHIKDMLVFMGITSHTLGVEDTMEWMVANKRIVMVTDGGMAGNTLKSVL